MHLLKLLKYNSVLALAGALIYAVHPMFTHAVAWIPSRGDLIIALLGILMFISFIRMLETKKLYYLYLHILAFALAVFSKETSVLFPLIFASYLFLVRKEKKIKSKIFILAIAYGSIIILFMYLRSNVVIPQPGDDSFGIGSFIKNIQALPEMYAKFFIPVNLSTMPKFSLLVTSIGIVLFLLTGLYMLQKKYKFNGMVLFSIIWFLMFSIPGMFYRHNYADVSYDYFEHRAYLPAIGLLFLIFEFLKFEKIKIIENKKILIGLAVLIGMFSVYSFAHSRNYRDVFSFYGYAISTSPTNALAYYNLGNYYKENKLNDKAKESFLKCIGIDPDYLEAYQNLATIYQIKNEHSKSIEYLDKALKINGNYPPSLKLIGIIYNKLGQNIIALSYLEKCIKLVPNDVEALNVLAVVYSDLDKFELAVSTFKKALEIDKNFKMASDNLASLYKSKGQKKKVIQNLQDSLSSNPQSSEAYNKLGEEFGKQGNMAKALEMIQKAVEIDPTNSRAYNNLGTAYAMTRQFPKAVEMYANASKHDPNNDTYLLNLGLAYNDNKQKNEAIATMKKAAQMKNQVAIRWLKEQGL
jgi:tetratricopeptide (TPR) repeat protein